MDVPLVEVGRVDLAPEHTSCSCCTDVREGQEGDEDDRARAGVVHAQRARYRSWGGVQLGRDQHAIDPNLQQEVVILWLTHRPWSHIWGGEVMPDCVSDLATQLSGVPARLQVICKGTARVQPAHIPLLDGVLLSYSKSGWQTCESLFDVVRQVDQQLGTAWFLLLDAAPEPHIRGVLRSRQGREAVLLDLRAERRDILLPAA